MTEHFNHTSPSTVDKLINQVYSTEERGKIGGCREEMGRVWGILERNGENVGEEWGILEDSG